MPLTIEPTLVLAAILLVLSVIASRLSDRFGVPVILVFLAVGMLAGSDGPGGIYFDDPVLAQALGAIALVIILFSGGLDTSWNSIRPVLGQGILLATLGVIFTALTLGAFAHLILGVSWLQGFLLGAIVSSTDAAAVFSILRSRGIALAGRIKPLLELESGSNDPMAVFLTIGLAQLAVQPGRSILTLAPLFLQQMLLGALIGILAGKAALLLINRLRLGYDGLYPVLVLGAAFLTYGTAALLGGSGFLAVYLAGLVMARAEFVHKRSLLRFFDGLAWLSQIAMFLVLGLLVFPSRLPAIILPGLALSFFLIFIARPVSVFLSLLPVRMRTNEKAFIAWVGLRGAVPIVLATYPRILGLEQSDLIFNVVFFVVITSVLLQGTSLPFVSRRMGVQSAADDSPDYPIEPSPGARWKGLLHETVVPPGSTAAGKAVYQLGLPHEYVIVLIARGKDFLLPNGAVILQENDRLLGLAVPQTHDEVQRMLTRPVHSDLP